MPDLPIVERTGFADEQTAMQIKEQFEIDGWSAEVIRESDGSFTVRAFPPDFGDRSPGNNVGGEAITPSAGAPTAPQTAGVQGLLDYIAKFESGGNYNAFFGNSGNQDDPDFTQMSLAGVLDWQRQRLIGGSPSSAAGRYQVIKGTLEGLISAMGLAADTTLYSEATQDQMAIKLLEEKGLNEYLDGELSVEDFANQVSLVWAALPIVTDDFLDNKGRKNRKGLSYYAGDGLNKAHAGVATYIQAIRSANA